MAEFHVSELAPNGITYVGGTPQILTASIKSQLAMDNDLVTTPNGGILAALTQYIDPELVRVLYSPMPLTGVFPEVQKGDWTTKNMTFPVVEGAGKPTSYGDWNDNGTTSANVNFEHRQPYLFQEFIRVGELEQDTYGEARINLASELQISCALSLNKLSHEIYARGVQGLQNYGMLNDPNLSAYIPSTQKWVGQTDPLIIFQDVQKLFTKLVEQTKGLVKSNDPLKLLTSPRMEAALAATNMYGLNVNKVIKENYPNLEVVGVPEYETAAGDVAQLILPSYMGSDNVQLPFNIKMRVHPIIQKASGYIQKRTQGCYGALIRRPIFIAQMLVDNSAP